MINAISLGLINNTQIRTNSNKAPKFPVFSGKGGDIFVSTIPKITKLSKDKIPEICPIYLRYRESANVKSSIAEVKKYLQTEFKKGDDSIVVAHIEGKPVGFLHYEVERSTLRDAERIRLKSMFVDEDYRGKGISKQLLQSVQQEAGSREVVVKARRTNKISSSLYLNNGFREDDEYYHLVYRKND